MKRLTILAALAVAGCVVNSQQAAVTAIMGAYTLAAAGVAAYADQPGSNPTTVAAARQCEAAAWVEVKPISDALIAKQSPAAAALMNAQDAVTKMQSCLSAWGVKS